MSTQTRATGPTLTVQLVDKVLAIRFADLPDNVVDLARQVTLDGIAVILAGSAEPLGVGRIITAHVRDAGGNPQSSVMAGGFKTSMANAALANGTMAHALDFDNTFYPLNHPTSPTLPAILAIAEARNLPGRTVIEAIATSFEVQGRLRLAATGLETGRGFHKPGTTGTIGATVAAARMLGLNRDQFLMALGTAGSRAGSISINTGTMTKSSHSGHAARMGVECALLAEAGWTANPDLFGPGGFFDAFCGGVAEPEKLLENFGAPFRIVDPGVGFKKYPCNYFTHRPIDAALALRAQHNIEAQHIAHVEVRFPAFDYVNRPSPATGLDGKFSVQYTTAVALLDGYVTVGSFSNDRRFADDMQSLLPRVHLIVDPEIPADFARMHVEVAITLDDGRVVKRHLQELSGFVGFPLSRDARVKKYESCARDVIGPERMAQVLHLVERLETLETVGPLMDLLR